ncbi:MAG: tripartite tricarboxylate transporter TctB family protein [Paracoccaceae bacterium]|nr:tripartite tricarboxylate transporter TctB family protein [Paracoccaceae bacterium]
MSDRLFGFTTAILALAFFASAYQLESPFFADPVGPKTFPYIIASIAFISGSVMILFPDSNPKWPNFVIFLKLGFAVIILVGYAFTLKPLGFLIPTALAAGILSFQIAPNISGAVITGILLSIILFIVFKYFLGLGLFPFSRGLI